MPPKEPPVETTAHDADTISAQIKSAYEKGYADGLVAGRPKLSIFEACKREVVQLQARDELAALQAIRKIMEQKKAEYGEFMPKADENLLLEAWKRSDSRRRSDSTAPVAPRQSRAPFQGEPSVEYEVVT